MPCVFCGHPTLTKEHVISQRIGEAVPDECKGPINYWHMTPEQAAAKKTKKQETLYTEQVRRVCQDRCNGGWMNRLEDRAFPILVPLLRGGRIELGPAERMTLGTWAAKVALMACYIGPEMPIPKDYPQEFFRTQTPPQMTFVWAGRSIPGEIESYRRHGVEIPDPPSPARPIMPKGAGGYGVTINICRFAFKVVVFPPPTGLQRIEVKLKPEPAGVVPIFPPTRTGVIKWPPRPYLDPIALAAMGNGTVNAKITRDSS